MAVKLGSTNISSIKLGSTDITSAYLGSTQIFGSSSSGGGSSGTSWSLTTSATGNSSDDAFGQTVALSSNGNTLAVSAVYDDDGGSNSGSVFVYSISGSTMTQTGSTITGDGAGDQSGMSLGINSDGDIVAIGSNLADSPSRNWASTGHIRAFEYSSSSWSQLGSAIEGDLYFDQFASVAINSDGTRVAGSSWKHDDEWGHVKVFDYDTSTNSWSQLGSDLDGDEQQNLGMSVAINSNGNRVASGAPYYDTDYTNSEAGTVKVWDWDGSQWSQVGSDIDGDVADDLFGYSVALSANGSRLAIGAPKHDTNGSVKVFEYSDGSWTQLGSDIDGTGSSSASVGSDFGWKVDLNATGSRLAVGAPNDASGTTRSGSVSLYDWNGSAWVLAGSRIDGENLLDKFGWSLSLNSSGNRVAVGAVSEDTTATNAGKVYVYDWA